MIQLEIDKKFRSEKREYPQKNDQENGREDACDPFPIP